MTCNLQSRQVALYEYRANFERELFKGQRDCPFVVRYGHVLGPYHSDKIRAKLDSAAFQVAYDRDGIEEVFRAAEIALKLAALVHGQHTMLGVEVEVEMNTGGLRKGRGVCHVQDQTTSAKIRVEGPWRKSRHVAEHDAMELRRAFGQQGLPGAEIVAAEKTAAALPVTVTDVTKFFWRPGALKRTRISEPVIADDLARIDALREETEIHASGQHLDQKRYGIDIPKRVCKD